MQRKRYFLCYCSSFPGSPAHLLFRGDDACMTVWTEGCVFPEAFCKEPPSPFVWIRWMGNGISSRRSSKNRSVLVAVLLLWSFMTLYLEQSSIAVYWYMPGPMLQASNLDSFPRKRGSITTPMIFLTLFQRWLCLGDGEYVVDCPKREAWCYDSKEVHMAAAWFQCCESFEEPWPDLQVLRWFYYLYPGG